MNSNDSVNASLANMDGGFHLTPTGNDSHETNLAVDADLQDRESSATAEIAASQVTTLQVINDDVGPPIPIAMLAQSLQEIKMSKSKMPKLKPSQKRERSTQPTGLEIVDDDTLRLAENVAMGSLELVDDDGPPNVPQTTEDKSSLKIKHNIVPQRVAQNYQDEVNREEINQNFIREVDVPPVRGNSHSNVDVTLLERNASVLIIPEAFLVEGRGDDIVAACAEPVLPWWKQKHTWMLSMAAFVVIICLAIGFGVTLTSNKKTLTNNVTLPMIPSPSNSSIMGLSAIPSSSLVPTFSPTTCVYKISTQAQKLDLPVSDALYHSIAFDGRNAIVVMSSLSTEDLYVIFYSLINDEWVRDALFTEHVSGYYFFSTMVALSGRIALVGLSFFFL